MTRHDIQDYAARFEISPSECDRIAATVSSEDEFVAVWENEDWWIDANNT